MRRLGQTVVVVGPNGAGKSRLFRWLAREVPRQAGPTLLRSESEPIKLHLAGTGPAGCVLLRLRSAELVKSYNERKLGSQRSAEQLASSLARKPDGLGAHVAEYIHAAGSAWLIEAQLQGIAGGPAKTSWVSLQALVRELLGPKAKLTHGHPHPKLFGRPIPTAELSDGQNVLLQIAVLLHVRGESLRGMVVLLDEADAHLHPQASLEVFRSLRSAVGDAGQLWVATHALHVAADAPDSVWFMRDGRIRAASRDPQAVARGLVGDEEGVRRIRAYLDEPQVLARVRFAAECLIPPAAMETPPGDSQTRQVARVLERLRGDAGRPLHVLDWGAGTGRLYGELVELPLAQGKSLAELVEYHAYDPNEARRVELAARIDGCEGAGASAGRVLDSPGSARDQRGGWFDVVVLMNVLHEIPPLEWLRLLDRDGDLAAVLAEGGYVVIIEDTEMPHGENAHAHGFLVLQTEQWRTLFGIASAAAEPNLAIDVDRAGRLQAHAVPRSLLGSVTDATRKDALRKLMHRAVGEMRALRQRPRAELSYSDGLRFERWVQSLANAYSALEELGVKLPPG